MPDTPHYLGRYRAERVVGAGAFATVWLAHDETLGAPVAIKVLAENWAHDPEIRERFLEEARILWRADSAHIVRIHNVDELPDGRPYFVMDYADRGTLHERMAARVASGQPWSVSEAVDVSLAIASGLKVAHALGIVHRDLKPANVMFQTIAAHHGDARDERLILTDFGIAKSLARSRGTTIATGTPYYMAPEQAEGRADERSDIYSAGVVLYELLAGRVPYPQDSPARLFAAQTTAPPPAIGELRDDVPAPLAGALVLTGGTAADASSLTLVPVSSVGANPWMSSLVPAASSAPTLKVPANLSLPRALGHATAGNVARLVGKLLRGLNPLVGAASTLRFRRLTIPRDPAGSLRPVAGSAVGLYGGTELLSVCDKRTLTAFLEANPDKAGAWAAVQGITTAEIPAYIARLTDVVLPVDTRVTNHGFLNGVANPIDEVLQAGTAVLIDDFGVPRARCFCGNPLTPPRPLVSKPTIEGVRWPGFTLATTLVIEPLTKVAKFTTTDVLTGITAVLRPAGSGVAQATILQGPAPAPPPVTTTTATTTTSTAQTSTTTTQTTTSTPTSTTTAGSPPPDLTGSWSSPQGASAPPWVLTASSDLQTLTGTWSGGAGHTGLRGSFTATLSQPGAQGAYSGSAHITEGALAVSATITVAIVSADKIEVSVQQSNQTNTQTFELDRGAPSGSGSSAEHPAAAFSPSPGRAGENFTLSASGFQPAVALTVSLARPDGVSQSFTITTDAAGAGSITFTNTQNEPAGTYTATITNPNTGAQTQAAVQVLAAG